MTIRRLIRLRDKLMSDTALIGALCRIIYK
jgi:hypothetical protein